MSGVLTATLGSGGYTVSITGDNPSVGISAVLGSGGYVVGPAVTGPPVAPAISVQPSATTVTEGGTATFSVTATGTQPLTYQWRRGGTNIGGATSPTYSFATVLGDNSASFDVVINGPGGTVTSITVSLTVNASGGGGTPDTRPRQVVGRGAASNATLFAAATPIVGSTNGSRIVGSGITGFTSPIGSGPDVNNSTSEFGNVFILQSGCVDLGGGLYGATFTDSGGSGGWSGTTPRNSTPTLANGGASPAQSESNDSYTHSTGVYMRFRMDYRAAFTGSIS